jgi:ABC-2 type transport system ATP-binding protein
MDVLQVENLSKHFGPVEAVRGLSLVVRQGEIFGFLGPNGAGKTTTISLICGLLKPDSGRILFEGRSEGPALSRERIGVCPQSLVLWGKLTCIEQLEFSGVMYGLAREEARRRGEELLETFGLAEKRSTLAGMLSGGMQRRLNFALALVHDPSLLILDEPEAGLDPQSRVLVREYIRTWSREKPGRTVIFTTHNMDEAERLVDRVAIIDHGKLLVLDTPAVLKRTIGEGGVLEVALGGEIPQADVLVALEGLPLAGGRLTFRAGLVEIHCPNALETLSPLLDALRRAGIPPAEVRLRENTLEDVFLSLTGRSLRE